MFIYTILRQRSIIFEAEDNLNIVNRKIFSKNNIQIKNKYSDNISLDKILLRDKRLHQ